MAFWSSGSTGDRVTEFTTPSQQNGSFCSVRAATRELKRLTSSGPSGAGATGNRGWNMGAVRKHDEWLAEKLKDAAFAAEYLNAAAEDDDAATYLAALRKVAEAGGGGAHLRG